MADPSRRASRNDDTADTANPAPGSANVKTAGTGHVEKDIKFSLITDSLPVLIAYISKDFRYRFVNKAY